MAQHRVSRKQVKSLCEVLSNEMLRYRLVEHAYLGKNDYYYKYNIVLDEKHKDSPYWAYKDTVLENSTLKNSYEFMLRLLKESLQNNKNVTLPIGKRSEIYQLC